MTAKKKIQILIVEDEANLRELLALLLTARGYEVHGVADGLAALDAVARLKPQLILLDIMIPEIDGFEICRQIKSDAASRHIPVIMLTAKKSKADFARAEQVGADWYLVKPFKSAMLIEAVMRFLAKEGSPD